MTPPGAFPGVRGVTVRLMSDGELARLEVLRDMDQRRLTIGRGTTARARAQSGIPAVEGEAERDGLDLEAAWSCEEPAQVRGISGEA
jgi:hypothetical protein